MPEEGGLPRDVTARTMIVPFNDLEPWSARSRAARRRHRDHRAGAHQQRRASCCRTTASTTACAGDHARTGTLLAYDETHTQVVGPGGLTRMWALAARLRDGRQVDRRGHPAGRLRHDRGGRGRAAAPGGRDDDKPQVAIGGTLFGNPLSMAAARATHERGADRRRLRAQPTARRPPGRRASRRSSPAPGLPWTTHRFWPRSGVSFGPAMPRNATEAMAAFDVPAPPARCASTSRTAASGTPSSAPGPTCSVAATDEDVDPYLGGVRLVDRGADGLGPAGRDALAFRDGG